MKKRGFERLTALRLWLGLCMFGLIVSASAQQVTFTPIDAPGAGVASGYGSEGIAIGPSGAVAGST
jgi:hypothetical protein